MTNYESDRETVLDVVIDHYVSNRIRYQDVVTMTIPEDTDEQNYVLQDMVRAALIARIKVAGHVDVPLVDGKIQLEYGQFFEIDHFPTTNDLRRLIPALCRKETLYGLVSLIKHQGESRWVIYPEELLNAAEWDYIKSSVGARALIRAADIESRMSVGDDECLAYLLDQATEILIRIWIKDHGIAPKEYAKWRVQGKQAIRRLLSENVKEGAYHSQL